MSNSILLSQAVADNASRPLEADLYSTDQQGLEQENISATGNLNIGVVIDYDARAEHQLGGPAETDFSYSSESMELGKEAYLLQPGGTAIDSPASN